MKIVKVICLVLGLMPLACHAAEPLPWGTYNTEPCIWSYCHEAKVCNGCTMNKGVLTCVCSEGYSDADALHSVSVKVKPCAYYRWSKGGKIVEMTEAEKYAFQSKVGWMGPGGGVEEIGCKIK